jgi:hypothetical protein
LPEAFRTGGKAGFKLAEPIIARNEQGPSRFIAGTALRADIIRRSQGQLVAIPKSRMIASVIVGVAARDIVNQPAVKGKIANLPQKYAQKQTMISMLVKNKTQPG